MNVIQKAVTATVLIVDDDEEDVFALRRVFAKYDPGVSLTHLYDGAAAVDRLLAVRSCEELPDIVLLDINMPGVDGFETLNAIRSSDLTRHLPVIMFSTSDSITEIRRAYAAGANAHLVKPSSMSRLQDFVHAISCFWLAAAALPNRSVAAP